MPPSPPPPPPNPPPPPALANVALGKTATSSGVYVSLPLVYGPQLAVDGIRPQSGYCDFTIQYSIGSTYPGYKLLVAVRGANLPRSQPLAGKLDA